MALEVNPAVDVHGAPVLLVAGESSEPAEPDPAAEQAARSSTARRRDAVVDAARSLEDLSPAGVEQLVRRRWRGDRPVTPEDFQSFSADARAQRAHDVVDALDFRIRRAVYGRGAGKQMHVAIPRGIVGKSLASLDPEETAAVVARLRDRGWSDQQIMRHGVRRFLAKNEHLKRVLSGSTEE